MKKIFTLLALAVFIVTGLSAQNLVSTDPMPKNALLDINGVKVLSQSIGNESVLRVELNNLISGLYTYRIVNGKTISTTQKLSVIK